MRYEVLFLVFSLAHAGCTSVALPQAFEPGPAVADSSTCEALFVEVAPDARPLQGRSKFGTMFLAYIPLMPYGHQQLSPEFAALSNSMLEPDFPHEVATTVIRDLRAARIASWVGYRDDWLPGQPDPTNTATLRLTLDEGIFHRKVTAYGLSFPGALLWVVGLPTSYGSAEIALTAEVVSRDGTSLGRKEFRGQEGAVEWLYRPLGPAYTRALPGAYGQISPGLRAFVSSALVD